MRSRKHRVVAALGAVTLIASLSAGSAVAAGRPQPTFDFSICQTMVPGFDENGDPIGDVPALEMFFSWSGAFVDTVGGSWTRSDGGDVLAGFETSDFAAGRSGTFDAGSFTIQTGMPELDGLRGTFSVHRRLLATRDIPEPGGGWTSVAACA